MGEKNPPKPNQTKSPTRKPFRRVCAWLVFPCYSFFSLITQPNLSPPSLTRRAVGLFPVSAYHMYILSFASFLRLQGLWAIEIDQAAPLMHSKHSNMTHNCDTLPFPTPLKTFVSMNVAHFTFGSSTSRRGAIFFLHSIVVL